MRPIGIRKSNDNEVTRKFGGMIYIFRMKYYDQWDKYRWYNLSTLMYSDSKNIIQLKRKLPTIEETT